MIKALIFDFFGVIRTDMYEEWLRAHGLKRKGPYEEASRLLDTGAFAFEDFLVRLGALQNREVTFTELNADATIDNEMVELVAHLSKHYKLGVLSNAPSSLLRDILEQYDLERYFDVIVVSSEIGMAKPDTAIYAHTLKELNVTSQEVIFIDDNPLYVEAAEKLDIKSVLFVSHAQLSRELSDCSITLN